MSPPMVFYRYFFTKLNTFYRQIVFFSNSKLTQFFFFLRFTGANFISMKIMAKVEVSI